MKKSFKNFSMIFARGIVRGFKWYGHIIKYESKWYILALVLDVILLPLKLIVVLPLAWFKPEIISESQIGKDIYYEMGIEDL